MSKRYTAPYSWRDSYLPNSTWGPTDASIEEGTTDTWTFREGIFLPGTHEDQSELSRKRTLISPKKYNVVLQTELSREQLLKFDIAPGLSSTPLVQDKVVAFFKEHCPNDFQAFRVKIRTGLELKNKKNKNKAANYDISSEAYKNAIISEDFYIINVTHWADILDHEKSWIRRNCDPFGHVFYWARNTIFRDDAKLDPHHLARVKYSPTYIAISPELRLKMKKAGFTGLRFIKWNEQLMWKAPPKEWTGQCPCPTCEAKRAEEVLRLEEEKAKNPSKKGWFW